jgi:release factor glutamine methyltransferase
MSSQSEVNETSWTLGRLLSWTSDYLARRGVDDARLAGEILLAHSARCRRIDLYARFDEVLDEPRLSRFRELVRRAAAREPTAYLVEEKEFYSLPLKVTPDVLIPRPETETLVERVIDHCTEAGLPNPWLLDLGTGCGCIVVAALVQIPGAEAVATDVSPAALAVCRENAARHGVSRRLSVVEADRLALPDAVVPDRGFDILMCNPPYVAADMMDRLDVTVRSYEPSLALTDGEDGLSFYRSIASGAPDLLAAHGVVIVEVGDGQAPAVTEVMVASGSFTARGTWKDRVTGHDRVLMFSVERADRATV